MVIGSIAGVLISLTVFTGTMVWLQGEESDRLIQTQLDLSTLPKRAPMAATARGTTDRPVYRHSVVSGGVYTPAELTEAIVRDQVVAAHYSGINPDTLRVELLSEPLRAHVSYRAGGRIYWTRRALQLQAGERVLTNGQTTIRARCGNIISADPLMPVLEEEPPPEEFDLRIGALNLGEGLELYPPPPVVVPPRPPDPPVGTPPVGTPFTPFTHVEAPLPVPEPSTLLLVGVGAAYLIRRHRRRTREA